MVTLVRRHRRVRQPAAPIGPSALAQELGCGLLLLPQFSGVNFAGSASYLSTSGTASDITFDSSHGRAYASGTDVYATAGELNPQDGYWFLFRGYISAIGTWSGIMGRSRNNGTTTSWAWYRSGTNNTLSVQNGSTVLNPRVLNDLLDSVPRTGVGLWRPGTTNNLELWRDGKQEMLASHTGTPDYTAGEGYIRLLAQNDTWATNGAWSFMAHGAGVALQSEQAAELSVKPWLLVAPRRIFVPVSVGGTTHEATGSLSASAATVAGSANAVTTFTSTGALSAQAATLAGSAVHLTLHTSSGALDAQAATLSGSANHVAVHASSGALTADAATVSGSASLAVGGAFSAVGDLTAQSATVAGTAVHYTLRAATGDLDAKAATLTGVATHLTLHTSTGALVADQASVSGSVLHTGDGAEVEQPRTDGHVYLRDGFTAAKKRLALQRVLSYLTEEEPAEETKRIIRAVKAGKPIQDKKPPVVMAEVSAEKIADRLIPSRAAELAEIPDIDMQAVIKKAIRIAQERDDEDVLLLL